MRRVAEAVSILAILVYLAVALSQWTTYRLELASPVAIATLVAVVLGLVWFSPLVAMFVVVAIAATYLVNELVRQQSGDMQRRPTIQATEADLIAPNVTWPYVPSSKTQSNAWEPYGRTISDHA